jgi:hypothetical protein
MFSKGHRAGSFYRYAGCADANSSIGAYGLGPPAMTSAKQLAEKALQPDPSLCGPIAHLDIIM